MNNSTKLFAIALLSALVCLGTRSAKAQTSQTPSTQTPAKETSADTANDPPESASNAEPIAEPQAGRWAIEPNPALPNVLIIGDSISIGYTLGVRKLLQDKANIFRPHSNNGKQPENCQGTNLGVQEIDRWLTGHHWDVIHFNFGLHDLKHVKAKALGQNSTSFEDPRQAEPDAYQRNLLQIVEKLRATNAKLIFATTTSYPKGANPARLPADAKLYNDIALEIMEANHIEVNDLYAFCDGKLDEYQLPKNVHFNPKGMQAQAVAVAAAIEKALENKSVTPAADATGE